jgi:hypothetical protein
MVFEKRALREILGCKGKDVTGVGGGALMFVLFARRNYSM